MAVSSSAVIDIPAGPLLAQIAADMERVGHRVGPIGVETARSLARVDTGEMRDGVAFAVFRPDPMRVSIVLYDPVAHSGPNEFGTDTMSAQPFIGPGGEEMERAIPAAYAELLGGRR